MDLSQRQITLNRHNPRPRAKPRVVWFSRYHKNRVESIKTKTFYKVKKKEKEKAKHLVLTKKVHERSKEVKSIRMADGGYPRCRSCWPGSWNRANDGSLYGGCESRMESQLFTREGQKGGGEESHTKAGINVESSNQILRATSNENRSRKLALYVVEGQFFQSNPLNPCATLRMTIQICYVWTRVSRRIATVYKFTAFTRIVYLARR